MLSKPSVMLNRTFIHKISNFAFGNLSPESCIEIFKDGRPFSHFIEHWISKNYPLDHVAGCKDHDFKDSLNPEIKYDEKTFTKGGCHFCPSNMIGTGRKFDKEIFEEKSKKMIFCIVSNTKFPEIKIKFVPGYELCKLYPKGKIPSKDEEKFFH